MPPRYDDVTSHLDPVARRAALDRRNDRTGQLLAASLRADIGVQSDPPVVDDLDDDDDTAKFTLDARKDRDD